MGFYIGAMLCALLKSLVGSMSLAWVNRNLDSSSYDRQKVQTLLGSAASGPSPWQIATGPNLQMRLHGGHLEAAADSLHAANLRIMFRLWRLLSLYSQSAQGCKLVADNNIGTDV